MTIAAWARSCALVVALPLLQSSGVGDVSLPNSGAAAAQPSFLYGLAQLHNFEYDDAATAFREAQRVDPAFALAFWGEAMTKNHPVWMEQDLGGARRVLERLGATSADRVAKGRTDHERAYLRATEVLFGAGDKNARDGAYLDEMRRLHAAYLDDVEATAFYGLALLGSAHDGRDVATYMLAAAVLEEAYATHPNHPGLAHYLIHSYDDPEHAPLGLRAARRYSTIAPSAPHALHMTSHIFLATGLWDDVVAANEQATAVINDRSRRSGRSSSACGHYGAWLIYGYLEQGRYMNARQLLDACRVSASGENGLRLRTAEEDPFDPDNIPAASYTQMWARYLIDTGGWTGDVVGRDLPVEGLPGPTLTRAFVAAFGAAARGEIDAARNGLQGLQQARQAVETARANRRVGGDQYVRRARVLEQEVRALVLRGDGKPDDAVRVLREAAAEEESIPFEFGPPFVDKPAHELLGDMLLTLDRPADAAAAYEAALKHAPRRTASLLGLARAASRAGSTATATETYSTLRQIWHAADRIPEDVRK